MHSGCFVPELLDTLAGGAQQAGGGSHQDSGAMPDNDGRGCAQLHANLRVMMLLSQQKQRKKVTAVQRQTSNLQANQQFYQGSYEESSGQCRRLFEPSHAQSQ